MELHRASKIPDWEKIPVNEQNIFQKIAAKTGGVATPGNAVSVAGLLLTHSGLMNIKNGNKIRGTTEVVVGRAMDIVDGYVADKTGTKSSVGEKFDATIDKILMADALWLLHKKEIVPTKAAVLIGVQNVVNTVATGVAMLRSNELHSSREGKITTVLQWAAIGGYCIDAVAQADQSRSSDQTSAIKTAADVVVVASTALGAYVNIDYTQTAMSSPQNQL